MDSESRVEVLVVGKVCPEYPKDSSGTPNNSLVLEAILPLKALEA